MMRVGIDTGGTFTDCVLMRDGEQPLVVKIPSTPANPARAILDGLERICGDAEASLEDVEFISHGTTVATNAMLQEQWAKVGLITSQGFRDVLEIGSQMRPDLYRLHQRKPTPLVTRDLREEVAERMEPSGSVVQPLDEDEARSAIERLVTAEVESLAVVLPFSYANPEHEVRTRELAEELAPEVYVCISSEVSPEFREYPRTSTTVINGALAPVVRRYIRHLREKLSDRGVGRRLHIMQSNGGVVSGEEAEGSAHNLVLSGPAGGVIAAAEISSTAGFPNALTFDMGGTSSDVGIIVDGEPRQRQSTTLNDAYPLQAPTVDIHTVGAGGGSIGWRDHGGALKVGPKSAGADPGPACYGRGGTEPTVTDANLYLGRLDPDYYLGGEFTVYPDQSRVALEKLATEMDLDLERVAWGIIEVANANMVGALRVVSSRRGQDPRDFALVAFGGAGPLHATALARELGIRNVLVPPSPGVLSALGLLLSDVRHDLSHAEVASLATTNPATLEAGFRELERRGTEKLESDGVPPQKVRLERSLDLRYQGQEYYLNVPISGETSNSLLEDAVNRFHTAHESVYGHAADDEPVETVNLRLSAVGEVERSSNGRVPDSGDQVRDEEPAGRREVYFDGHGWIETPIYRRGSLGSATEIEGPLIVEQVDTTLVVEPRQWLRADRHGNLIVTLENGE